MVDDDEIQPLGGWDDAYAHFARHLRASKPDPVGASQVHPALVRLRADPAAPKARRHDTARRAVERWLAEGTAVRDAHDGPLPPDDTPFTLYWADSPSPDAEARFGAAVEVLSVGRRLDCATLPMEDLPSGATSSDPPLSDAPVMAVIDDGIGFLNARFRTACGSRTRFHAVWLMAFRAVPGGPGVMQAGRVVSRAEIDGWLALGPRLEEAAVYRRLNAALLEPMAHRATEMAFSHGTHVLDTAAGADPGSGDPAADGPLLAVQLPPEAVDDTAGTQLEPLVVRGLKWILAQAEAMGGTAPVITTVALATFAGPKDGTKVIEALIAQSVDRWQARTGRTARVVLSFGNARRTRQAAAATLTEAPRRIDWRLLPDDRTASYLELRVRPVADLSRVRITLTPPGSTVARAVPALPPDSSAALRDGRGAVVGRAYHIGPRKTAPGVVSPPHLVLAMAPTVERGATPVAPHGAWRIGLSTVPGGPVVLRLEVQRDDTVSGHRPNGRQSYLDDRFAEGPDDETRDYGAPEAGSALTRAGTHSCFANAPSLSVLVVAAARADDRLPAVYSAEGLASLRPGPTLAALSDRGPALRGLIGAGTLSGTVRVSDGTSVAAARVARALADLYRSGPVPAPGGPETAALIAASGVAAPAGLAHRLGAGILTRPVPRA